MKKIIFFDIDNTIVDNKTELVPPKTLKMLQKLSEDDNFYLGIATGRGPGRLDIIKDILHLFDAFVLSNGAYIILNGEVIYDHAFPINEIEEIIKVANKYDFLVGASGLSGDSLLRKPNLKQVHLRNAAKLNPNVYKEVPIYQMWMVSDNHDELELAVSALPQFDHYFWTTIGVDLTINNHSKGQGILKIKELLKPIQVISIGDGHNDIDMIEVADIGIAMANSRFDELKEKADLVGPCVSDDLLCEFLEKHKII